MCRLETPKKEYTSETRDATKWIHAVAEASRARPVTSILIIVPNDDHDMTENMVFGFSSHSEMELAYNRLRLLLTTKEKTKLNAINFVGLIADVVEQVAQNTDICTLGVDNLLETHGCNEKGIKWDHVPVPSSICCTLLSEVNTITVHPAQVPIHRVLAIMPEY